MWIRIGFNADPDLTFYLSADRIRIRTQGSKPMRIQADLDTDPDQTFESQKVEFLHEKYT
jgi:hypothetical protein